MLALPNLRVPPQPVLAGTLNQILKAPAHNQDHLAAALRDELMPARSWWLKNIPWAPMQLKVCCQIIMQQRDAWSCGPVFECVLPYTSSCICPPSWASQSAWFKPSMQSRCFGAGASTMNIYISLHPFLLSCRTLLRIGCGVCLGKLSNTKVALSACLASLINCTFTPQQICRNSS